MFIWLQSLPSQTLYNFFTYNSIILNSVCSTFDVLKTLLVKNKIKFRKFESLSRSIPLSQSLPAYQPTSQTIESFRFSGRHFIIQRQLIFCIKSRLPRRFIIPDPRHNSTHIIRHLSRIFFLSRIYISRHRLRAASDCNVRRHGSTQKTVPVSRQLCRREAILVAVC